MALPIQDYMRPGIRVHLVGVGGVSMAPLAEVLHGAGVLVSGSDLRESAATQHLRSLGIPVVLGHRAEQVESAQCVIRTAAAHEDNPEIFAARAAGIPVFERAEGWGAIMRRYQNALCVAGTHGKTTTTSMCVEIFLAAGRDPTVMLGGTLPSMGAGHRVGQGDTIILESCEYCNSFHAFFPTVAVILNVDADHLDFFGSLDKVRQSFRTFALRVPPGGTVVANCEDTNTMEALAGLERPLLTFGLEKGEVHAENVRWKSGFASFDLVFRGERTAALTLAVPGAHNLKNALAAAAAALSLGVSAQAVAAGLSAFRGVGRRFEYKGRVGQALVYDDYAHHPSELRALLETVKGMDFRRVICAFQPHTYTRTQELFEQFVEVLSLADRVVLAEIYAAREENETGISSAHLAREIPGALYCPALEDVTRALAELAGPGDVILTVGAGDIHRAGEALVEGYAAS